MKNYYRENLIEKRSSKKLEKKEKMEKAKTKNTEKIIQKKSWTTFLINRKDILEYLVKHLISLTIEM